MSPIQRGNVQTKLFQLCSTLKAQLLHDGGLHRDAKTRPRSLTWLEAVLDLLHLHRRYEWHIRNIQTYSENTIHMKVYQAWSRNLVASCKVCRLEAVAPGNNLKQQESCTSTLAPKKPKRFVIKAYNTHQYISIQFYSIYSSNGRSIHWPKNIVIFTRAAIKHQARSEALLPKSCHFIYGWFHSSRRKLLQQILSKQNFEGTWRDHKTALPEVVLWAKLMSRTCASQNAETISLVRPAFSLQLLKITFSVTMISEQATPSPVKRH